MVNPVGTRSFWHEPIDSITIERDGVAVCLSDAMRRVTIVAESLDRGLSEAFAREVPEEHLRKTHAADLTIRIVMQVLPEKIVSEGSVDPELALPAEDDGEPQGGDPSVE
jgi:hypothetical protein